MRLLSFRCNHFESSFLIIKGAVVDINTLDVAAGRLPRADRRKVIRWAKTRQRELLRNWERIERKQTLERIEP